MNRKQFMKDDESRIYIAPRRSGKTELLANTIDYKCNPVESVYVLSPNIDLSKEVIKRTTNKNMEILRNAEHMRGHRFDKVFVDELCYLKPQTIDALMKSTKQIVAVSTPHSVSKFPFKKFKIYSDMGGDISYNGHTISFTEQNTYANSIKAFCTECGDTINAKYSVKGYVNAICEIGEEPCH